MTASVPTPILITNAKILTMDPVRPRAEAMLLCDGRIAAIGNRADVEALKTAETRVIDAGGKTVLPGLSENHLHLFSGAAELDHLQLAGVHGYEALEAAARAYAAGMAAGGWVLTIRSIIVSRYISDIVSDLSRPS